MADILQMTFSDAFSWKKSFAFLIGISLNFVADGVIDNKSALVQVMAWHRTGAKPLLESMMAQFIDASM